MDWYRGDRFVGETDYQNEEIDALLDASAINMDDAERAEQIQEIQRIANEEQPHIMLHQETVNYGVNDRVNFSPAMDEMIYVPSISKN